MIVGKLLWYQRCDSTSSHHPIIDYYTITAQHGVFYSLGFFSCSKHRSTFM